MGETGHDHEPKEIRWYDADHDLGPQAELERRAWLIEQLELDR